ncbi:CdaR family transcriptional regulator [Streptomyces sp. ST2-7A]|uniref:PucR family transcriptional regulator n=1 Tax=Streptomyces sp. ST2-7A TaxID=2907214 RepID=UPI001F1C51AA|nr:helix-turn-helix domain-containing protein [Streptomyces sp. ST2-7A]MCE7083072.1 helix-turn-helix domain-containing protein [Streptomyces sp. ST2-7A]
MCDLLNRLRSCPPAEWNRILLRELPSVSDGVVDDLTRRIPGFSALVAERSREVVRRDVEQALRVSLGTPSARADVASNPDDPSDDPDHLCDGFPDAFSDTGSGHAASGATAPRNASVPRQAAGSRDGAARQRLLTALTGREALPATALRELSDRAGWPLPRRVQAVVLGEPGELSLPAIADVGEPLSGLYRGHPCVLLPDPGPVARPALTEALRGRTVAVGQIVPLQDAASTARWARRLLALAPAERVPDNRPLFVDDHLTTLLLLQDESLLRTLSARWLRPMMDLTPRQRERLEATLLAWLEGGGAPEAAKALRVHPQTVHYRLRQLEKLYGPALRDPRSRLELELTLHSRHLVARLRELQCRQGRSRRPVPVGVGSRPAEAARAARVNGR